MRHFSVTVMPAVVVCHQSSVWVYAKGLWVMLLSDLWQIQLLLPKLCDLDALCGSELLSPWSSACCHLFATVFWQTRHFQNLKSLGENIFLCCFTMQSSRCLDTNTWRSICRNIGDFIRCVFFGSQVWFWIE